MEANNVKAMREALVAVKKSIDGIGASSLDCDPTILMSSLTQICGRLSARIERALAAPPRNCDAFSKAEVLKVLEDRSFSKEDTIEWLYSIAAERKEENNGSLNGKE